MSHHNSYRLGVIGLEAKLSVHQSAPTPPNNKHIQEKQQLHSIDIRGLIENLLNLKDVEIKYYGTKVKKFKHSQDILDKTTVIIDQVRQLRNSLNSQRVPFITAGKLRVRDGDI